MKHTLNIVVVSLLLFLGFTGCSTTERPHSYKNHIKARVTYYHKYEDKFGAKVAMPSVKRAQEGITVAARRKFPFGTGFFIPDLKNWIKSTGKVLVQDRGSAVEKLKASRKQAEVIDVYIEAPNRRIASQRIKYLESNAEPYMDVYY